MKDTISLSQSENKLKFTALREAGYDTLADEYNYRNLILCSKKHPDLDRYVDTTFRSINDILKAVSSDLMTVGYKVVA
jgi:hypothetical protein